MELVEIAVQRARATTICVSLASIVFHVQVPPKSQLERAILSHLRMDWRFVRLAVRQICRNGAKVGRLHRK